MSGRAQIEREHGGAVDDIIDQAEGILRKHYEIFEDAENETVTKRRVEVEYLTLIGKRKGI
jgi:hypothetical protein